MFPRNGKTCRLQTKIDLNRLKIYLIGPNSFFFALLLVHLRGLYEIFNWFFGDYRMFTKVSIEYGEDYLQIKLTRSEDLLDPRARYVKVGQD